jgi:glycosyltransferase involved in cell wall biosynthesis
MAKSNIIIQFICYSPRIYSGFDKYNLELASVLKEKGFDSVFVFCDSIEVQSIIDDLIAGGVTFELISSKNKITILRDIVKLFLKYKPAVVHAHFENFIQLLTAVLSLIFRSKYFISFHSLLSLMTIKEYRKKKGLVKQVVLKSYYRFIIAVSENVFCISNAIKSQFSSFSGSKSEKIQCLYLGVKLKPNKHSKTKLRSFLSLPEDSVLLCNVSAIEHIKGLDILLKAVYILKKQYNLSDFKCCHIGGLRSEIIKNVYYRDILLQQVKELNLENEILWLGHRNDINEILSAFDIYVHPSRLEGLSVSIMEACSQSLPAVGARVGGIPEIIHHDNNGFLFSAESAEELAAFLNELINDKELREKMGKESFKLVEENFNIETQTKLLANNYLASLKTKK